MSKEEQHRTPDYEGETGERTGGQEEGLEAVDAWEKSCGCFRLMWNV